MDGFACAFMDPAQEEFQKLLKLGCREEASGDADLSTNV
jgi:hypothetical protein